MNAPRAIVLAATALALALGAGRAAADGKAKATPDLTELKYLVAAADKRGQNVGAISEALAALEKTLAKGTIKPGEAPPELAALREAVEFAAKKGENVEAISKELGAVEKALTGREYERPKPVEPPRPELPTPPGRQPGGVVVGGGIVIKGGGGNFSTTSITISNGDFVIRARRGDVSYLITGTTVGNEPPKIVIQDGEKKIETDDLKKVPDQYRPAAEQLLKRVSR